MRLFAALLAILSLSRSACAYIDPGTGAMIVGGAGGALWALGAAVLAAAAGLVIGFYGRIKAAFSRILHGIRGESGRPHT
jgi:hypothetical protein